MPHIKIGDAAIERGSDRFGIVTEISAKYGARITRGPKEDWWIPVAGLEHMEAPDLGGGFKFGQFVKRLSKTRAQAGMMLKFEDGLYTMLGADAKSYPKGTKFLSGKWYKAAEIAEVTPEEKDLFLFKLNPVHTPDEYVSNLARIYAGWDQLDIGEAPKRFKLFWNRLVGNIGDRPGVTWGARLRTIYSPAPSINFRTADPGELKANMFAFFDLLKTPAGLAITVFLKRSSWIPESAKALFPKNRDAHFYMDGHWTLVQLAEKSDEDLVELADTLAGMYKTAEGK